MLNCRPGQACVTVQLLATCCRAAVAGLGSAAVSELLTQQSVMSQLLGRWADAQ